MQSSPTLLRANADDGATFTPDCSEDAGVHTLTLTAFCPPGGRPDSHRGTPTSVPFLLDSLPVPSIGRKPIAFWNESCEP